MAPSNCAPMNGIFEKSPVDTPNAIVTAGFRCASELPHAIDMKMPHITANAHPAESVVDVYGPGYVVQAEEVGPGLAFAAIPTPSWQETTEMRAMRRSTAMSAMGTNDRVEVEVRLADLLSQGGRIYPVESVTVERVWYFTLPAGGVEVREAQ